MYERQSQRYSCLSRGCANGYGSSFEGAPEVWFRERNMTPPKNCPNCRAWIKSQYDEATRCRGCGRTMRLSARYKISHHKRTGPWALPEECRGCERGEGPSKGSKLWTKRAEPDVYEKVNFDQLPVSRWPGSYAVDVDPANYDHPTRPGSLETRRIHIEAHTDWSVYSKTSGDNHAKSPTALSGKQDFGSLLRSVNSIAQAQALDTVREYEDVRSGRVVRVTLIDSSRIEVTIIEPSPDTNGHRGYELVTTYDNLTVETVKAKLKNGEWR